MQPESTTTDTVIAEASLVVSRLADTVQPDVYGRTIRFVAGAMVSTIWKDEFVYLAHRSAASMRDLYAQLTT